MRFLPARTSRERGYSRRTENAARPSTGLPRAGKRSRAGVPLVVVVQRGLGLSSIDRAVPGPCQARGQPAWAAVPQRQEAALGPTLLSGPNQVSGTGPVRLAGHTLSLAGSASPVPWPVGPVAPLTTMICAIDFEPFEHESPT